MVIPHAIYRCPYAALDKIDQGKFPEDIAGELLTLSPEFATDGLAPAIRLVEKSIQTFFPLTSPLLRNHLYKRYNISAVDMESHAVMKTASGMDKKCCVIQVITDHADEQAVEDFKRSVQDTMEIAAPFLLDFLRAFNR